MDTRKARWGFGSVEAAFVHSSFGRLKVSSDCCGAERTSRTMCSITGLPRPGTEVRKTHDPYFHPELLTGTFETVTVTEIIDPNNLFCRLHIFSKALKVLSEQIHQHYEASADFEYPQPRTCGEPCAAKGVNGRWRRSLLKPNSVISDGAVEVFHVDEGITEVVPVGDVRPLHVEFLRMPVVTYLCSLDGVTDDGNGWTTDQSGRLRSLLLNQTVIARFDHHNISEGVYCVTLFNAACVNTSFMEETEPLPPSKSQQDSDVQKAPSVFLGSLKVGQRNSPENKGDVEDDDVQEEPLLSTKSTKSRAVSGCVDGVASSGANGFHTNESSEHSHAPAQNGGRRSAGFPNNYSANDIEVGEKEKVWITSAETIHHFYCQLERNSDLLDQVVENVNQIIAQLPRTDHPLGLDSICCAKYSDGQWYRGQIVEVSPRLKVHFVDYGDTLVVNESDLHPIPLEPCAARSVPVLAVPLGLFDVPEDVPQEVNQWFADHATHHSLTLSVVAKGTQGNLIVELFDGSLNVNAKVREKILKMMGKRLNGLDQQPDRRFSESSGQSCEPSGDFITQEHKTVKVLRMSTKLNDLCDTEELQIRPESVPEAAEEYGDFAEDGQPLDPVLSGQVLTKSPHMENPQQRRRTEDNTSIRDASKVNGNISKYQKPEISENQTVAVYASCIAEPNFFWCQYANSDVLSIVSMLAQEAGKAQKDAAFAETLGPGCPCLALFSGDDQWYRVQVTQKNGDTLHVLFVDYGNEADVDIDDVRPLPQGLLELAPQAFLCQLHGFETKGSWGDEVYDDFYSLLLDKPLRVTVMNTRDYSEFAVPQFAVEIECEGVVVNTLMEKYWKDLDMDRGVAGTSESVDKDGSVGVKNIK